VGSGEQSSPSPDAINSPTPFVDTLNLMSHAPAASALRFLPRSALLLASTVAALVVGLAPRGVEARTPGSARQRVAVLRLGFEGGVPEAARDLFGERLVEGLAAAQFEVLAGLTVHHRLATAGIDPATCDGGNCLARAASALEVGFLVVGSVDEHDKTYEITLELVNGRSGVPIGTNRERCEICGVEEAGEKVGLAASALRARLEALARTPARFIIRSRPTGARVVVDGDDVGRTPLDHELSGGVHRIELSAEGFDPLARTVTAVSGVDETRDYDLVPLPTKFPFAKAGWGALVLGVAALATGIAGVVADGHEASCPVQSQGDFGHCPNVYDTGRAGAALVGVGAVAATLGITWIYFSRMGTPAPGEPAPTGLTVGTRF
jgi:hypothetical protein